MSRFHWFVVLIVCAAHFSILGLFYKTGKPLSITSEKNNLAIRLNVLPEKVGQVKGEDVSAIFSLPPKLPTGEPTQSFQTQDKLAEQKKSQQVANTDLLTFNRNRFFDLESLDAAAVGTDQFELALSRTLPAGFEFLVLEFLIDQTGQTVQINCLDGECSSALNDKLQELLLIPFVPAVKDGVAVPSRKVLLINPLPNLSL